MFCLSFGGNHTPDGFYLRIEGDLRQTPVADSRLLNYSFGHFLFSNKYPRKRAAFNILYFIDIQGDSFGLPVLITFLSQSFFLSLFAIRLCLLEKCSLHLTFLILSFFACMLIVQPGLPLFFRPFGSFGAYFLAKKLFLFFSLFHFIASFNISSSSFSLLQVFNFLATSIVITSLGTKSGDAAL